MTVQPLAPLRVVDLSTWIAGAYCSRLLADGGASVDRVDPPGGNPLRRWSASGSVPPGEDGALYRHLTGGHTDHGSVAGAEIEGLLAGADACIWSPGGALDPGTIAAAHPDLVVVSITPFGLDTPWTDRPATEFTLQGWSGGMIGLGRGAPERPPVHVGGQVGEWLSGAYAAVAALAHRRTGRGGLVDLSMLEVQAMCLTYYPVTFHDLVGRPMRKKRALTVPGVAAAADGLVGLGVGTGQQWLDFCAMTGHPEWTEDVSLFTERGALADDIDAWVGSQNMAEVLDLASAFRLPNAPIVNGENAPNIEHLSQRESFVSRDGFVAPRSPLRITPGGGATAAPTRRSQVGPLPFSGLRVLDMTAYWAGPSAGHLLAMLGAEVIHLESDRRPDGARAIGVPPKADLAGERGPIFAALNTDKKSLTIDFTTDEGLANLRRFIPTCDVVIENFTPRVLDQVGLTYESMRDLREDLILVRMPGFGLDGPWRDNAAFAFVIEDASGLTWLTGHADQNPVEPYCVGDSNAGLHAAYGVLVALAHRDSTGEGCQVEAAMVDAALSITAEQVIERSAYGALLERAGNRGPTAAPQNLYDCADLDQYGRDRNRVAIAVATDDQWSALRSALGDPAWAADPALRSHAGRTEAHDEIDSHLQAWCGFHTADEVVDALWAAGVPVSRVMYPHDQPELAPLQHRRFFEDVEHPVAGTARYSTVPFRFPGAPDRFHHRHAPLLGEHTDELLRELEER